jgi:hypothetical protein
MRDQSLSVRFSVILFSLAAACTSSAPGEAPPDGGTIGPGSGSDTGSGSGSGSGSDTGSGSGSDTGSGSGSDMGSGSGSGSAQPLDCDYTEQDDTTNDYLADSPGVEDTGLTYANSQMVICGVLNNGHYDSTYGSVDIDNYSFTAANDGNVLVTLRGNPTALTAISSVAVFGYNPDTGQTVGGYFTHDHAAVSLALTAGTWQFDMESYDNQDAAASTDYQLVFTPDFPAQRCAQLTSTPNYTESLDGADSTGNDAVAVNFDDSPEMWMLSSQPENTGLSMTGGLRYRVSGVSADIPAVDSYFDRDTFLVTTDATTNQLSLRLNTTSQTADLNYYVFPAGDTFPLAQTYLASSTFATLAVAPSTSYWVWIGAASDSTALPASYDVTLCSDTFVTTPVP